MTHATTSLPTAPIRPLLASLGVAEVADRLGRDRRALQRALARPRLRAALADELAVACGRHPWEVWPEWFDCGQSPPRPGSPPSVGA